jgi:hypothetical protein
MTEQHDQVTDPGEPLVTLCGPFYVGDAMDLATGLRFRAGKAAGVPLSVARKYAEEREGYYVEPHGPEKGTNPQGGNHG